MAVGDEFRESTEGWADLLRDLKRRGIRAPVLGIGRSQTSIPGSHLPTDRSPND